MKRYLRNMSFTSAAAVPTPLRRNRDFTLAVAARTISLLGDFAALVALTLRTAGHGPWAVSALLIAGFLPIVLMTPVAGLLVDRVDSRALLIVASLTQLVVCLALARAGSPTLVLALVFLLGCGDSIAGATWSALLPGLVGRDQLATAIGVRQAAATAAGILAPALGGVLTGIGGASLVLNLDAASFLAIGAAALLVRHRRTPSSARAADDWRSGFSLIRRDPVLCGLIGALFVFCLVAGMANVVTVFLIRQTLHAGATWFGMEGAVCAAAMTVGALASGRVRGTRPLVVLGLVGMGGLSVSCIGYSVAPSVGWLMIPAAACGFANAALNVSVGTVTMLRAPEATRGRVSAAINGVASSAMIGSMLVGGLLAAMLTPREVFAVAGFGTLVIAILLGRRLIYAAAVPMTDVLDGLPVRDNTNRAAAKVGGGLRWSSDRAPRSTHCGGAAVGQDPYRSAITSNRPPTVTEFCYRTH